MKEMPLRPVLASLVAATLCWGCRTAPSEAMPAATPEVVRLATWNLEHLAEENGLGCRPRTDSDYLILREHAERLGADVIAFQEVENSAAAARVFPAERWMIVMSERQGSGRSNPCREGSTQRIRKQEVGFAVRRGLGFRRNSDLRLLGLGDPDLRWGVDITLLTRRPIRLLAVHLKSGCNTGNTPDDPDCPIIFAQAPHLERWIDERAQTGEDFAILGDWNRRMAAPGDPFLAMISDDDPPGGRLTLADSGRRASCIERYPEFIDHIALGERAWRRLIPGSFVEYLYGVAEAQYPADHCPQSVDMGA